MGVLKLGLRAMEKALPHGDLTSWPLDSCRGVSKGLSKGLGVSKALRKNEGEVGVLVGVGGSPPGKVLKLMR